MKIKSGEKFLLIRYSNLKGINCMEEHISVLENNGFVWFGKIGGKLNKNFLEAVELKKFNKNNYVILASKDECYFCEYSGFKRNLENGEGFPKYYYEFILKDNIQFSIFLKLIKVIKVDKEFLKNFIVSSSRNNLLNALKQSMSAHFFIESNKDLEII